MTSLFSSRARRASALAAALVALGSACTEPRHVDQSKPTPTPTLDARIDLSDSLASPGSEVIVTARLVGAKVASATARLLYDTTGAQLIREEPIDDGATRVMNPQPGVLRFAGVTATGFVDGRVYAWRFVVRRTSAMLAFRLVVDEAHTISRADATASLSRKP